MGVTLAAHPGQGMATSRHILNKNACPHLSEQAMGRKFGKVSEHDLWLDATSTGEYHHNL